MSSSVGKFDFVNNSGSNDENYESVISSFIRRFREEKPTAPADRLVGPHSPKEVVLFLPDLMYSCCGNNLYVSEIILVVK
jgi:hypothetical protein